MSLLNYHQETTQAQHAGDRAHPSGQATVPNGSIGTWTCCEGSCVFINHLIPQKGEYAFGIMKCGCGHVMCEDCSSDDLKFDTSYELVDDPNDDQGRVSVDTFQGPCPYFSLCGKCGLTYRASPQVAMGDSGRAVALLTFRELGRPCNFCREWVNEDTARIKVVEKRAVDAVDTEHDAADSGGSFQVSASDVPRTRSFLKTTMKAAARMISGRSDQHKAVLDPQSIPGAQHSRRHMDRDHNLPYGWEVVGYDGECYTYQDDQGKLHRTNPGSRYGPYIDL